MSTTVQSPPPIVPAHRFLNVSRSNHVSMPMAPALHGYLELVTLDLSHNSIASLPSEFSSLDSLK
jgi:hypothetical protein